MPHHRLLERRLDAGSLTARSSPDRAAASVVNDGHIRINGRRVNIVQANVLAELVTCPTIAELDHAEGTARVPGLNGGLILMHMEPNLVAWSSIRAGGSFRDRCS